MITNATLKNQSLKDLGELAKSKGISGWRVMKKEDLVRALTKVREDAAKPASRKLSKEATSRKAASNHSPAKKKTSKVAVKSPVSRSAKPPKAKARGESPTAKKSPLGKSTSASSKKDVSKSKPKPLEKVSKVARNGQKAAPDAKSKGKPEPTSRHKSSVKAEPVKQLSPVQAARIKRKISEAHERHERERDLSHATRVRLDARAASTAAPEEREHHIPLDRDQVILVARDPYWLHAMWVVTRHSVERARAAMAEHWHSARPILRVIEVDAGTTTNASERVFREIEVHGGVQNWYFDVQDPPRSFRVDLGYRGATGKFFSIIKSNIATTPTPGVSDSIDQNWRDVAQRHEKAFHLSQGFSEDSSDDLQDLFDEKLRRPMSSAIGSRFGVGAERLVDRHSQFHFEVDAEMLVFGATKPDANVTLNNETLKIREDGSFTMRLKMPDKRQVIAVVAQSKDGLEQRTVVLAVERNTKVLEPRTHDSGE